MSPAVASRVFEPFFTTKERGKGSGLGLSMVYNFAKRSNGTTILRSTFGKGTTVSLLLPDAGSHIEAESRDERVDGLPGGSETILLVEDEPLVRKLAKRSLLGLGYNVLEAENAAEAVKVVEGGAAVDLLVSDIIMPGPMKGPELARWILQRCPRSKVLLTTGFSEAETGGPFVDKGDFHLLRKPYTKKELAAAVRAVLDAEAIQNSPQ
jgi:CheY-like chemotaxis protein